MAFKFHEIVDSVAKCQWCRDNIGDDGNGWWWDLEWSTVTTEAGVIIHITNATDAMAFKLRWL